MQKDNIIKEVIKAVSLKGVLEFTIQKEAMTREELSIIRSYGFFLVEYFTQDNYTYYTFRRKIERIEKRA